MNTILASILSVAKVSLIVTFQVGKIELSWFGCEILPHIRIMPWATWSPTEGVALPSVSRQNWRKWVAESELFPVVYFLFR